MSDLLKNYIDSACTRMKERYDNIFLSYYPAHDSTGFTERNLTNNFVSSFESVILGDTISWYEAPIADSKKKHIDAILINHEMQFAILIEAKRLANPQSAIRSINADIDRITNPKNHEILLYGLSKTKAVKNIYGLIIADVWKESPIKRKLFREWPSCITNKDIIVKTWTITFEDKQDTKNWKNNYSILIALIQNHALTNGEPDPAVIS